MNLSYRFETLLEGALTQDLSYGFANVALTFVFEKLLDLTENGTLTYKFKSINTHPFPNFFGRYAQRNRSS